MDSSARLPQEEAESPPRPAGGTALRNHGLLDSIMRVDAALGNYGDRVARVTLADTESGSTGFIGRLLT